MKFWNELQSVIGSHIDSSTALVHLSFVLTTVEQRIQHIRSAASEESGCQCVDDVIKREME
jgi:hypothetical protein